MCMVGRGDADAFTNAEIGESSWEASKGYLSGGGVVVWALGEGWGLMLMNMNSCIQRVEKGVEI